MRQLRVLHIGNIANNAYNIAKALRQRAGVEADVFTHGYCHYISQPEWEDADIAPVRFDEDEAPNWSAVDLKGFVRPEWYSERLDLRAIARLRSMAAKDLLRSFGDALIDGNGADQVKTLLEQGRWDEAPEALLQDLHAGLAAVRPRTLQGKQWHAHLIGQYRRLMDASFAPLQEKEIEKFVKGSEWLRSLFRQYDIVQTYGVWEPMWPLLLTPSIPRVAFEHGSMREHPFHDSTVGRLLALSYKTSRCNVITNADAVHAMRRLGLSNCRFIPHPVDDEKFRPAPSPIRERLLAENECSHVLFAPARQNWEVKGNDKLIRGFAVLRKRLGPGPKLFLSAWGQEIESSRALVRELGIENDVVWLPPLPKRRLAEYMNASDVVLDQFVLGCFGTTTPEAMACAKPVLLYYRPEDHAWCLPEHPPVVQACAAEEIAAALERLLTRPEEARRIGEESRAWFLRHHSLDLVVARHLEIYEAIGKSPATVPVPAKYSHVKEEVRSMSSPKVTAVVRCSDPLDSQGQPKYLRKVCGVPLIDIMAGRLRKLPQVRSVVMVMEQPEPETCAAARRLGWRVLLRHNRRFEDLGTALRLATCDGVAFFNLNRPFVDPVMTSTLMEGRCNNGIATLRVTEGIEFLPTRYVKRNFAIRAALVKIAMRGTALSWQDTMQMLLPYVHSGQEAVPVPPLGKAFVADSCSDDLVAAAGGVDFTLKDVRQLAESPEAAAILREKERRALAARMADSPTPHLLNRQLNDLENSLRCDELLSFPTYLGVNLSSYCNVRCRFCSYHPATVKNHSMLTLEQFQRMTWLKYVSRISLFAGIGDSLVNPAFRDILRYTRETFPHLDVDFFTNGKALTEEIVEDLIALQVKGIHCSLNAAREKTYNDLVHHGKFQHTVAMLKLLAKRKKELGSALPEIGISAVMVRENVEELPEFVQLAKDFDPKYVSTCHYATKTTVGNRELTACSSLYAHKELADRKFDEAKQVAADLGVNLVLPAKFGDPHSIINGIRVPKTDQVGPCAEPWRSAYLTVDETGEPQFIFCCSGVYYGIKYDRDRLDEESFRRLWNHKIARYFRRTVHRFKDNPLCEHCCTRDRFEPDDNLMEVEEKMKHIFTTL